MVSSDRTAVLTLALKPELVKGCSQMGVKTTDVQASKLIAYLALLDKWNKAYNLSAVREVSAMLSRHLLDSLSIVPFVRSELERCRPVLDVGTGAGLPGVPLAILFPDTPFTLLDSNGKRIRFLFQVKTELGLDNLVLQHCRVQSYQPEHNYTALVSRAFSSLEEMTESCAHLLREDGVFWAMKGLYPKDELSRLQKRFKVLACHELQVPGCEASRHLLILANRP